MPIAAELLVAIRAGSTVIVPSRQRAAAVRVSFARTELSAGRRVWQSPDVLPWDAWLNRALTRSLQATGAPGLQVLNTAQEDQLWTQALASLTDLGEQLAPHAAGIGRAAALLREWRLPVPAAGASDEAGVLAAALRAFRQLCNERLVVSANLADDELLRGLAPQPLVFAGFEQLTPRQQFIAAHFREHAVTVVTARATADTAQPQCVSGRDWREEAAAAGQWAAGLMLEDPRRRLLIVSANRQLDPAALQSILAEQLAPAALLQGTHAAASSILAIEGGKPLERSALVRTALALLSLAQGRIEFATLSRVLLSPHYGSLEASGAACAGLELWLRDLRRTRFDWPALRRALLSPKLPTQCTDAAQHLSRAIEALRAALAPGLRLPPRQWAQRASEQLRACGFPGPRSPDSRELQLLLRWQELLEEFASLDAVAGSMSWAQALQSLQLLAARIEHQAATGDAAVTLTYSRDDPIVRYDGIWVMGLEDQLWPEALRPDSFIPVAAQRAAGMPGASVTLRLAQARHQLANWATATSHLVLSYPRHDADLDKRPSILLRTPDRGCVALAIAPFTLLLPGQATNSIGDARLPAIPLGPDGIALHGGAKLPGLQRDCPFRAQAELRLGAVRLAPPAEGIDPRQRGQLLHHALERVWRQLSGLQQLLALPAASLRQLVDASIDEAMATLVAEAVVPPEPRLLQRERERTRKVVLQLLELEKSRSDFSIEELELQASITVDEARLRLRIDRVDRLPDGSLAVLDYKSGQAERIELLGERARPVQLLTYLAALDQPVTALALVQLAPAKVVFKGVTDAPDRLPLSRRWEVGDWAAQQARWREDVFQLIRSHIAGDARVDPARDACRYCHLPALCRIDSLPLAAAAAEDAAVEGAEAEVGADE